MKLDLALIILVVVIALLLRLSEPRLPCSDREARPGRRRTP